MSLSLPFILYTVPNLMPARGVLTYCWQSGCTPFGGRYTRYCAKLMSGALVQGIGTIFNFLLRLLRDTVITLRIAAITQQKRNTGATKNAAANYVYLT
ncbi:hypothetical protein [Collimonas arenae]|nr:hypothetical protein [Collimonas arenae]